MISNKALLISGETRIGRYTVDILRSTNSGAWQPSLMQLDATVTNHRLILRPFRKRYRPASLPNHFIVSVELTQKAQRHCIALRLKTGHRLYLLLSTGKLDNLYTDLQRMKVPTPNVEFTPTIDRQSVQRMIAFFGEKPRTPASI